MRIYSRLLTYLMLLVLFACNNKPDGFIINGELTGFKDSTKLYLYDTDLQNNIDSTLILNGKFQFKGNASEPKRLYINTEFTNYDDFKFTSFFVENNIISLKGDYDNFQYCNITGSKSQIPENKLITRIKKNYIQRDSLTNYFFRNTSIISKQEEEEIWRKAAILDSLNEIEYLRFIREDLNSYSALEKLKWHMPEMSKDTLQMYYKRLTPLFKESTMGKLLNAYLNSRTVEIGKEFIDFNATTINGEAFKLSDIKTDYILLDFWAANCGPCRSANKELAKHYSELQKQLEIVSFSLDVKNETIQKASDEDGIIWTNITDYKGNNSEIAIQYQITGIPCSYLINKERIVIKKYVGFDPSYMEELNEIILKK